MTSRMLQFIFGVIVFICSTPAGMAQEAILEEARADFFLSAEMGDESGRQAILSLDGAALLPGAEIAIDSEDTVQGGKQVKRTQKRSSSSARFFSKLHFSSSLSPEARAKGVARHPQTQDARQERTALIRFLQISSLAC